MTSYLLVRMFFSGVVCIGTGWTLYCLTPAGSAEREQTRRQKEMELPRRMYREPKKDI